MIYKDQLSRELNINKTPKRIISLVPSLTELLVDLGLEDSIIGVTKFCVHPKDLRKQKTVVGGTKNIKLEKIKALNPDIILCNKEENSQEIVESLKDVASIHISDINNLEDAFNLITSYGDIFKVNEKAKALIFEIKNERILFQNQVKGNPKIKVAYFIWKTPWLVAASNTFIDAMLTEANFENVFSDLERYPEIQLDNKNLKNSDIIMLSSEPYPFKSKHIEMLEEKFSDKKIILVDGELFSWYGSRLRFAFKYFKTLYI